MLKQFSWQEFFLACIGLSVLWYLVVGLVFFRKQVSKIFSLGFTHQLAEKDKSILNSPVISIDDHIPSAQGLEDHHAIEVLGKPKLPEGMSFSGSNQICFAGSPVDQLEQIGLVADVVQEIKGILQVLEKQNGEKKDFLYLLETVRDRYPDAAHCPSLSKINDFIREHAFFSISENELQQFWS